MIHRKKFDRMHTSLSQTAKNITKKAVRYMIVLNGLKTSFKRDFKFSSKTKRRGGKTYQCTPLPQPNFFILLQVSSFVNVEPVLLLFCNLFVNTKELSN
ncbi:hypothetical protein NECAME_11008 [Necator americanus]|uniref:Uncharacterized protein n=1 Tax=Necator americanus TaxID=51031 RepID=W2T6F2_NECAM|nr:hypothetical protein NECAME_11008 [Necator americanus]ETN77463.1 hypothetical protein NECAME_11008 [Necator americanus]